MKILTINEFFANKSYTINADGSTDAGLSKQEEASCPKTKEELQEIIKHEIDVNGLGADLNFINTKYITDMSSLFSEYSYDGTDEYGNNTILTRNNSYDFHKFYGDISQWDTSSVTNMACMFSRAFDFDCDISTWDVSSVTNMANMFADAHSFYCDLNEWDVSNVTNMSGMFYNVDEFNSKLDKWDVSNVKYMNNMFCKCTEFNNDISMWNVSNVKYFDYIFDECNIKEEYKPHFKS